MVCLFVVFKLVFNGLTISCQIAKRSRLNNSSLGHGNSVEDDYKGVTKDAKHIVRPFLKQAVLWK